MGDIDEIRLCEDKLRAAMLAGDAKQLDRLIGDGSVFTDQNGRCLTKSDDLSAHRSGLLAIDRIDVVGDQMIRQMGSTAIVCVTMQLEGAYDGQPFAGTFAYSRIWLRSGGE